MFVTVVVGVGVAPVNGSVAVGVGVTVGVTVGDGVTHSRLMTTPFNISFLVCAE